MLTLERIVDYIEKQGLDEYTTKGLIEEASKYPHQALGSFRRNFNLMIQRVRARRKKEQQGIENEKQEAKPKIAARQAISLDEAINFKSKEEVSEYECHGAAGPESFDPAN
jgi:DNA primase catalytic subunit